MKQALISLIRTVVRSPVALRASATGSTQLSSAQLRLVSGGVTDVSSPKSVW